MEDIWTRFTTDMLGRLDGPMQFRLYLQPAMAAFFAIRDGLADARTGKRPYFASLVGDRAGRAALVESGWKSIARVFMLAVVLDVVYQLYVLRTVYPIQALSVALILAIVPYLVLRGIVTRIARREIRS